MPQQSIDAVLAFLEDIARQTDLLANATGLRCKTGCGKCCENPHIETTVTELLPMARHLWQSGLAEQALERIARQESAGRCVLFEPDPLIPGNGRCGAYAFRPGICRLFGFAAKRNAAGQKELVTCRIFKEELTALYQAATRHIAQGGAVPSISDHTMNVFAIDPQFGHRLMPLNQALRTALQRTDGLANA